MIIPDKLKLNKFKLVLMPRNADYFRRFGAASVPDSAYADGESSAIAESKTEQLNRLYNVYAEQMRKEQH